MNNEELVAISDIGTQLLAKETDGTFKELIQIKGTSDTKDTPEELDVTTMAHPDNISIFGRCKIPNQEMPYNYTETNYAKVEAKCGDPLQEFIIKLSDGSGYHFKGEGRNKINGNKVNGVQEATLTVAPTYLKVHTKAELEKIIAGTE